MEQSLRRESFYRAGGKHIAILCYVYFYFILFYYFAFYVCFGGLLKMVKSITFYTPKIN